MTSVRGRWRTSAEGSRGPLWLGPSVGAVGALIAVLLLERVRPERGSALARLWLSDVSSAATALQAVAATSVTVTTLTFSVTVVTLQLASQQFSPRLLRRFARDRATKIVLTVLTVTYVFTLTTLSFLDKDRPVPAVAMWLSFALGLVSLAAVLGFLTHIVRESSGRIHDAGRPQGDQHGHRPVLSRPR